MHESEFLVWANNHDLRPQEVESLQQATGHADDDTLVGRVVLGYDAIAEYTDEKMVDACPFDFGFVVFGECPNGDPVAIDVRNNVGTIHYLSHELSDGSSIPSIRVANTMQQFLMNLEIDKMPTDYHEALGWEFPC